MAKSIMPDHVCAHMLPERTEDRIHISYGASHPSAPPALNQVGFEATSPIPNRVELSHAISRLTPLKSKLNPV